MHRLDLITRRERAGEVGGDFGENVVVRGVVELVLGGEGADRERKTNSDNGHIYYYFQVTTLSLTYDLLRVGRRCGAMFRGNNVPFRSNKCRFGVISG